MDSNILKNKGFSLIEVTLTLSVISIMMLSVSLAYSGAVKKARVKSCVTELNNIAINSQLYYKDNNSWPSSTADLYPDYTNKVYDKNFYGYSYIIFNKVNSITIYSHVPANNLNSDNVGSQLIITNEGVIDRITITKSIPMNKSARLAYEKKYLYNE